MPAEHLARVLERIDQLNSDDPNTEVVGGVAQPQGLVYARRLTDLVLRLAPHASEGLRIAARGQHVRRWTIPRDRYERNRRGYLRWRETLKAFHAETVAGLMREAGYGEEAIQRVRLIMSKRRLQDDPDTQTLEDALCLVFLESQFADFRKKTPEPTMRDVLRKTWQKMSERGRSEALGLALGQEERAFLVQAVAPSPPPPVTSATRGTGAC